MDQEDILEAILCKNVRKVICSRENINFKIIVLTEIGLVIKKTQTLF